MDRNKTGGGQTKYSAAHYSTFIRPRTYKHTGVPSHEKVKKRWTSRDRNVPINTGHATVDSRSHTLALPFRSFMHTIKCVCRVRLWRMYACPGMKMKCLFWKEISEFVWEFPIKFEIDWKKIRLIFLSEINVTILLLIHQLKVQVIEKSLWSLFLEKVQIELHCVWKTLQFSGNTFPLSFVCLPIFI